MLHMFDDLIQKVRARAIPLTHAYMSPWMTDLASHLILRRAMSNFTAGTPPTGRECFLIGYEVLTGHEEMVYFEDVPSPSTTPPASDHEDEPDESQVRVPNMEGVNPECHVQ